MGEIKHWFDADNVNIRLAFTKKNAAADKSQDCRKSRIREGQCLRGCFAKMKTLLWWSFNNTRHHKNVSVWLYNVWKILYVIVTLLLNRAMAIPIVFNT